MAISRNPYAAGSPGVRGGTSGRVTPDPRVIGPRGTLVRNPGIQDPISDSNYVGVTDPWETGDRPGMFWSDQAPDLSWGIDWDSISRVPTMDDFSADATRVEQATMDRAMGLLDPVFNRREMDMSEAMANRGLPAGSSVNRINKDQFGRDYADAYEKAALDSVFAGRQEQSRLFGQALQSHEVGLNDQLREMGFDNAVRGQAWSEQMGARDQLFRELMGQLGTSDFNPNSYLPDQGFDPTNFINALTGGNTGGSSDWTNILSILGPLLGDVLGSGGGGNPTTNVPPATQDNY